MAFPGEMKSTDSGIRINRMINNAGTGGIETSGRIHEMKEETWDFVMSVTSLLMSSLDHGSSF